MINSKSFVNILWNFALRREKIFLFQSKENETLL